jgi:hypothetical protein
MNISLLIQASADREITTPFAPLYLALTTILDHPSQVLAVQCTISNGKHEKYRHGIISEYAVLLARIAEATGS